VAESSWETVDLLWFRRTGTLPRLRRLLALGAVLAAIGWALAAPEAASPGPLAAAHRALGMQCRACHASPWQGWRRFRAGGDTERNAACLACHAVEIASDPARAAARHSPAGSRREASLACSRCHREHEGLPALAAVADEACASCHADLGPERDGGELRELTGPALAIASFAARGPLPHPPFRPPADPGHLRFNHRLHVAPEGRGPQPPLACAECHALEDYARPVRFAAHCARCHALSVDGPAGEGAVPHASPEVIRLTLAGRMAARDGAAVARAERLLYDPATGVCARCHEIADGALPSIVPTSIPDRWLPRARFDHARHRADPLTGNPVSCLRCHEDARRSERAKDVLLPTIDACRACHARPGAPPEAGSGGASDRCVECHGFHRPPPGAGAR
jgi:hypothetical protein